MVESVWENYVRRFYDDAINSPLNSRGIRMRKFCARDFHKQFHLYSILISTLTVKISCSKIIYRSILFFVCTFILPKYLCWSIRIHPSVLNAIHTHTQIHTFHNIILFDSIEGINWLHISISKLFSLFLFRL